MINFSLSLFLSPPTTLKKTKSIIKKSHKPFNINQLKKYEKPNNKQNQYESIYLNVYHDVVLTKYNLCVDF